MNKKEISKGIMVFSGLGVLNASYLTYVFLKATYGSGGSSFCDINSTFSCSDIVVTPYAQFFGVPTCTIAIPVYLILFYLAYKIYKGGENTAGKFYAISVLSGMGLMMNLIYVHNEYVFLKQICLLCLICMVFITANLILSIAGYRKSA
ncbi:MAG: vitamin K epoxide reductase family protein [Candidatus Gracilibacteria bacterium]|jgi:uncharacterized membrane protein